MLLSRGVARILVPGGTSDKIFSGVAKISVRGDTLQKFT